MEINLSSPTLPTQSTAPNPSLAINLSRSELIDLKIQQVQERQDRNYRRDLLRDSLSVKSALRDLERLMKKGEKQVNSAADPVASSSSSQGLDTSGGGDLDIPIDQVSSLSGISSGNIIVMGEKISIDVTTDSINDVIDAINNSGAGVTASYNTSTNKLEITDDQSFTISNGTSSFFAGLDVSTGEIVSEEEDSQVSFFKSDKFVEAFKRFNKKLTQFFETTSEVSEKLGIVNEEDDDGETLADNPFAYDVKKAIENAVTSQWDEDFDGSGKIRFDYGLTLSFTSGDFAMLDTKEFNNKLDGEVSNMLDFFLTSQSDTDEDNGGLFALLEKALDVLNTDLESKINSKEKTGLLVDTEA